MPPNFFQRPETALRRAQELIQVGKEADALEALHDTIKARRHKQWTQTHEAIMLKHVELCVLLKKPHVAKDALFQYKALTQQIAVKSLETVIEHFLNLAESKTEEAQKTSIEKVEEIDDLDQGDVPETLLLSVVSGAAAQDRMDRTVLAPWLRFLWDSYRNCLELLRNNAQVEQLYHRIARKSFTFCAKYQRRTEFRKLCELLRLHLNHIQKHQHVAHVVKLTSPESLAMMQETRLCQLDTAIQMELWQEAYRSAEDVHAMMQLSKDKDKRTVKAASYVNYYDKLALVFWKAGNVLFHAAALLQKFTIYRDMKRSFTADEAQEQASRVLLATLAIPDGADSPSDLTRHLDIEDQHLANIRLLSNLLRLPIAPTRAGILKEAARLNVTELAGESTKALYRLLENNFAPLRLSQEVENVLLNLANTEHGQYMESLRYVVATKSLKQISMIYDSISWGRIKRIIPFYNDIELERLVVDISKHRFVKAQIDHRSGCVKFGAADATLAGGVDLEEADGFTGDDTQLGVEGVRTHLEIMYNKLRGLVEKLDGDKIRQKLVQTVEQHAEIYKTNRNIDFDHIMKRRTRTENYKEAMERMKAERTQQAQADALKRDEEKRAEEMKRLQQENLMQEQKRRQAEHDEVQRKIRQDQLRKMQQTSIYQAIIREKGEAAFQDMDPEAVLREQRERLDKERLETQTRLQQQEKTFDHYIRAIHLEEMLERKAIMMHRMSEAPKLHDEFERKRVEKEIDSHNLAVKNWERIEATREEAAEWMAQVKENNTADFAKKVADWKTKLAAVRADRLAERAMYRKKERRDRWLKQKQDEEKRQREEEERTLQKKIDDHRMAQRNLERGGDRSRRDDGPSKAMDDNNWRRNPTSQPMQSSGGSGFGMDRDRDRGGDRAPMREREANVNSAAEKDQAWRSSMGPAPLPSGPRPGAGMGMGGMRPRELERPRVSAAPSSSAWERGRQPAPPPSTISSSSAADSGKWERKGPEAASAAAPGKFVPSSLRKDGPGAGGPATQGNRGGFGSMNRGLGGPMTDRDRRPPAPIPRPSATANPDADRNWRK